MNEREKIRIELMAAESADLAKGIREFLLVADRLLALGGVLAFASLTLGLLRDEAIGLVLLPFLFGVVLAYMLQIQTEVLSRAGYKKRLEEVVNAHFGECVLADETAVAPTRAGRKSVYLSAATFALAFVLAAGIALAAAVREGGAWPWIVVPLLPLPSVMLVIAAIENLRAYDRAYAAAQTHLPLPDRPIPPPSADP